MNIKLFTDSEKKDSSLSSYTLRESYIQIEIKHFQNYLEIIHMLMYPC